MLSAQDAIASRMRLISAALYEDDIAEAVCDVQGYISALRDFGHISEAESGQLDCAAKNLGDEVRKKLRRKNLDRR